MCEFGIRIDNTVIRIIIQIVLIKFVTFFLSSCSLLYSFLLFDKMLCLQDSLEVVIIVDVYCY